MTTIYYSGTPEEWDKIDISYMNNDIFNAEIKFNEDGISQQTSQTIKNTVSETNNDIKVKVDGKELSFDQPPVILNGRTLVPLRAIFEALGAEVEWDSETKSITATKDNVAVLLVVDLAVITSGTIGGTANSTVLDSAPTIINGRTMVPARAIAEAFDCTVDWNSSERTVVIVSKNNNTFTPENIQITEE